jgi:hypothetical protein
MGRKFSNLKKSIYVNLSRRYLLHKEKYVSFSCFWHNDSQKLSAHCLFCPHTQIYIPCLHMATLQIWEFGFLENQNEPTEKYIKPPREQITEHLPSCI